MPRSLFRRLFAPRRPATSRRLGVEALEQRWTPASAGRLDLHFATGGKATLGFDPPGMAKADAARAAAVQPDGKLVVAGTADGGTTADDFAIARFNRDGKPDTGFGTGGRLTLPLGNIERAQAVVVQPNGRILVAGTAYAGTKADFFVVRLLQSGALDPSFNDGGIVNIDFGGQETCADLALQPDGKIVLAGSITSNVTIDMAVARLNGTGELDTTFNGTGKQVVAFDLGGFKYDYARGVVIQKDGKVVLGGVAQVDLPQYSWFALARLNGDGSLDPTFDQDGKAVYEVGGTYADLNDLALAPDGKLVLVGSSYNSSGTNVDFLLARVLPNGALDAGFNSTGSRMIAFDLGPGFAKNDAAKAVLVQPDGKIVVAGTVDSGAGDTDMVVVRLNPNGTNDGTFGNFTRVSFDRGGRKADEANALAVSPDGIYVVGSAETDLPNPNFPFDRASDFAVARLVGDPWVVVGGDVGSRPLVRVMTPTGTVLRQFYAFGPALRCGVRVATGDINGDGKPEIFAAPGEGGPPVVRAFDGASGAMLRQIVVADARFTGGVNLAFGVVGFTHPDGLIVVGLGRGSAPVVRLYNPLNGALVRQFLAYPPGYRGGVRVLTADVLGGGNEEVVYTRQDGSSPFVTARNMAENLTRNYRVANGPVAGGFHLAAGNVNGKDHEDLIVGFGSGAGLVKVFEGLDGSLIQSYQAFGPKYRGGVHVVALDTDGDGDDDVLTAALLRGVAPRDFLAGAPVG
ncbi:MAG: delta-60 repeat domain-containing protein [Gemmataceae bacterium]